jgi:hypothetical protein
MDGMKMPGMNMPEYEDGQRNRDEMTRLMRPGLHMERTTLWRPHLRLRHDQRDLGTGARAVSSRLKQGRLQTVREKGLSNPVTPERSHQ